jgi:hypothetical protein
MTVQSKGYSLTRDGSVRSPTVGRRLSVNVSLDVGDAIDKLAKKNRITITEVIRRAVSTYKFIDDEVTAGGKILEEKDGTLREVKFLW